MTRRRIRVTSTAVGPVLRISVDKHFIAIPVQEARAALDAAHDALDAHEAESRRGITSGFFSGGEMAQIPEGDFDADRE